MLKYPTTLTLQIMWMRLVMSGHLFVSSRTMSICGQSSQSSRWNQVGWCGLAERVSNTSTARLDMNSRSQTMDACPVHMWCCYGQPVLRGLIRDDRCDDSTTTGSSTCISSKMLWMWRENADSNRQWQALKRLLRNLSKANDLTVILFTPKKTYV